MDEGLEDDQRLLVDVLTMNSRERRDVEGGLGVLYDAGTAGTTMSRV